MTKTNIPTYAEIASFKAVLIKDKKNLHHAELEAQQEKLARMEFSCLRTINSLSNRTDNYLMDKARQLASLERFRPNNQPSALVGGLHH